MRPRTLPVDGERQFPSGIELAVAFAAGLSVVEGLLPALAIAGLAAVAAARRWLDERGSPRGRPAPSRPCPTIPWRRAAWAVAFAALGAGRGAWSPPPSVAVSTPAAGPLRARGCIVDVPIVRTARDGSRTIAFPLADGRGRTHDVIVRLGEDSPLPPWRAGDDVEVLGRARHRRAARNPGDSPRGLRPLIVVPTPRGVARMSGSSPSPARWLLRLRQDLHDRISSSHDGPARGLLLALLLGDRRQLDPDLRDGLLRTGTYHFLAISGLHVGVVLALLVRVPLPRPIRLVARLALLGLFGLLTGASAPVVRAVLMLSLDVVLRSAGRTPRAIELLGWTALVSMAARPDSLHDVGFRLSFTAVAALIVLVDAVEGTERRRRLAAVSPVPPPRATTTRLLGPLARAARRVLIVSLVAGVATAPWVALHFQRLHPLGPLATLLVQPLAITILLGGFLVLGLGAVHPGLGSLAAEPVDLLVALLVAVVRCLEGVPGMSLRSPPPSPLCLAAVWTTLFAVPPGRGRALALVTTSALLAAAVALAPQAPQRTRLVHFDLHDASSTLLELGDGTTLLVDAGVGSRGGKEVLLRALVAGGHLRIDGVVLTHAHADHVAAVVPIARELGVGTVFVSTRFEEGSTGRTVLAELTRLGVRTERVARGDTLVVGDRSIARVDVLCPGDDGLRAPWGRVNDGSIGLRLRTPGGTVLILGDLEHRGLAAVLSNPADLGAEILVLPHHGREQELLETLVSAVRPEEVVASGDGRGGGERVARRLEGRGVAAWATWRGGAIVHDVVDGAYVTRYGCGPSRSPNERESAPTRARSPP